MGKSGVEPEGKPSVEAMWANQANRLELARNEASVARKLGKHASAHSRMLSAYITLLSGDPVEGRHPAKFFLFALWYAFCMWRRQDELDHNQLDVWLQFTLKLRAKMPVFKSVLNKTLLSNAGQEVKGATTNGKNHQLGLALLTYAEVLLATVYWGDETPTIVKNKIRVAVDLESLIREESEQPQGLRQLVRILRKAGELYIALGDPLQGKAYLNYALTLAQGEADAPDQVPKIKAILAKI